MEPNHREIQPRLELARAIAREAGRVTLDFFQRDDLQVDRKADDSPVTAADRQAEQLMRERIRAQFPEDTVLGEESGQTPGSSAYRWVLDPIDGTNTFVAGVPLYTTLVGVLAGQQGVVGVIHAPVLDEMVYAASGCGAWCVRGRAVPRRAQVSAVTRLAEGLFVTTAVASFTQFRTASAQDVYLRLQAAARMTRTWGDGYGYLLVATGRAEVMVDPALNLWDAAPVQTILEEAGGTFTDWQGRATVHGGDGIGTNGRVHDEVLRLVR
ncbi:MAG: histidinol-phosphatase [Planctomycetes bacterium RBG_16_64_10]|nr:MAG: histidinol-phosphatase [Planctomycetes bacterium RBG_16_64_10]